MVFPGPAVALDGPVYSIGDDKADWVGYPRILPQYTGPRDPNN